MSTDRPDPRPTEPAVSNGANDQIVTGTERASIKLIWDTARALAHDPEALDAMAQAHPLGPSGHCSACRPRAWWPCPPWLVAALARATHTSAPQAHSWPHRP